MFCPSFVFALDCTLYLNYTGTKDGGQNTSYAMGLLCTVSWIYSHQSAEPLHNMYSKRKFASEVGNHVKMVLH